MGAAAPYPRERIHSMKGQTTAHPRTATVAAPRVPGGKVRSDAPRLALALMLALLAGLALAPRAHGGDDWMRVATAREDSEVSIWSRYVSGEQMKQFRGETHIATSTERTLALLLDTHAMPGWLWRCDDARILHKAGPREYIVYMRFRAFWPLADRDAILRVVPEYEAKTGTLALTGTAMPDYLPAMPGVVRVPAIASRFVLQPAGRKMRVEMTGHFDPGGIVPLWAANLFVTVFPKHSLTRMREILEGQSYAAGPHLKAGKDALAEIAAAP